MPQEKSSHNKVIINPNVLDIHKSRSKKDNHYARNTLVQLYQD